MCHFPLFLDTSTTTMYVCCMLLRTLDFALGKIKYLLHHPSLLRTFYFWRDVTFEDSSALLLDVQVRKPKLTSFPIEFLNSVANYKTDKRFNFGFVTSKYGNLAVSLPLWFYVKLIFPDLRSSKTAILIILEVLNFDFWEFHNWKCQKF